MTINALAKTLPFTSLTSGTSIGRGERVRRNGDDNYIVSTKNNISAFLMRSRSYEWRTHYKRTKLSVRAPIVSQWKIRDREIYCRKIAKQAATDTRLRKLFTRSRNVSDVWNRRRTHPLYDRVATRIHLERSRSSAHEAGFSSEYPVSTSYTRELRGSRHQSGEKEENGAAFHGRIAEPQSAGTAAAGWPVFLSLRVARLN